MKKTVLFLITTALLLSGCIKAPTPEITTPPATESTPEPTVQATEAPETSPVYSDYEAPMLSLTATPIDRSFTDNAGNTVMTFYGQSLELLSLDPQVSEAVTLSLLNLTDYNTSAAPRFLREIKEAFASGEATEPCSFRLLTNCTRLDMSVCSLVFKQITSGINARSNITIHSVSYDLISGKTLKLKDILIPDYSAAALVQSIVDSLAEQAQNGQLYSDYAYVIDGLFHSNTEVTNWYLDSQGLCFYFSPYEIAPYNMGVIVASISYAQLEGLLREEYYPEESIGLMGKVFCRKGSEWEGYSQYSELILNSDAEDWTIFTEGAVEDFRIETGSFQGGNFQPQATVFACATLCSSDALLIQANADDLENLLVTYTDGGETLCVPLSELICE